MTYGLKARDATCSIADADAFATTAFGTDVPYIMMRMFADDICTSEVRVLVRRLANGNCFRDNASSSYRFAVRTDAEVQQQFFATPDCSGAISSLVVVSSSNVLTNVCVARTTWAVRNVAFASLPSYHIEKYYTDATCSTTNRVVFTPLDVFVDPVAPVACTPNAQGIYYSTTSDTTVDPDFIAYMTFADPKFYVMEHEFFDATCTLDFRVSAYSAFDCIDLGDHGLHFNIWREERTFQKQYFPSRMCDSTLTYVPVAETCIDGRKYTPHLGTDPAPTPVECVPIPSTPTPTTAPPTTTTTTPPPTPTPTPTPTATMPTPTATLANLKGSSTANSIAFSIAAVVTLNAAVVALHWLN